MNVILLFQQHKKSHKKSPLKSFAKLDIVSKKLVQNRTHRYTMKVQRSYSRGIRLYNINLLLLFIFSISTNWLKQVSECYVMFVKFTDTYN